MLAVLQPQDGNNEFWFSRCFIVLCLTFVWQIMDMYKLFGKIALISQQSVINWLALVLVRRMGNV